MSTVVSRTDLARNTRKIVDQVCNGQMIVVQSHGQDQIVLLDALDYRILNALAKVATAGAEAFGAGTIEQVMYLYPMRAGVIDNTVLSNSHSLKRHIDVPYHSSSIKPVDPY